MFDVSSSFKSEAQGRMVKPVRRFYMSTSDYSDRVKKWPKIKRDASQLKSISLSVNLANVDGGMNEFYKGQYKLKDELKFKIGVPDLEFDYSAVFSDYTFSETSRGTAGTDYVKVVESVNSDTHYIYDHVEVTKGLGYNTEIYFDVKLKAIEKDRVRIGISDGTTWPSMLIYLDTGSYVNQNSDYISHIEITSDSLGSWRGTVGVKNFNVSTVTPFIALVNSDDTTGGYDGDGSSGIWAGDATLKRVETIDLYTGEISKVSYTQNDCVIKTRDKLWGFAQKVVGDSDTPVKIPPSSQYLISDIAWTLCTCYGELDSTQDSSNADINYESFAVWAEQFSTDNVFAQTHYEGMKVMGALTGLARMSDSSIWIEGDGKLYFKRFVEVSSDDITFTNNEMSKFNVDIDMDRLINKQWVYFGYVTSDDYWNSNVFDVRSTSVNTFGLRENVIKEESIWYVDSVSALNLATRRSSLLHQPNRKFNFISGLYGIHTRIGDTIRLVNSFYDLTSSQGWTVDGIEYDMATLKNQYQMDEALVMNTFYLDVSTLDGDHLLL